MPHVDSVYNFGKRTLPIWIVLKDLIQDRFLKDGKPIFPPAGGLRKKGKKPNLPSLVEELLEQDKPRVNKLMEKYALLNQKSFQRIQDLKEKQIIFTDPVSPVKMDPDFLFSYLKHLQAEFPEFMPTWYSCGSPNRVFHDPFSPVFAQSDAIMLLAGVNPDAFHDKILKYAVNEAAYLEEANGSQYKRDYVQAFWPLSGVG